jgi:hypothetical protein
VGSRAVIALVALGMGIGSACSSPSGASARSFSLAGAPSVRKVSVPGFLYPGAAPTPIRLTLKNRSGRTITVKKVSVVVNGTSAPGCSTAWFQTTPVKGEKALTLHAKRGVTLPTRKMPAPTIAMIESGANQDACQGARLTLSFKPKSKRAKTARVALASAEGGDGPGGTTALLALPLAAGLLVGARGLANWRRLRIASRRAEGRP